MLVSVICITCAKRARDAAASGKGLDEAIAREADADGADKTSKYPEAKRASRARRGLA